jgi:hypothetical protein
MFEFKNGELAEAEMPEWLDLAIVEEVEKGLESQGYRLSKRYGEEFGFGVAMYERDCTKPLPWSLPECIAFLRYISPIVTAGLLSELFGPEIDVVHMLEQLKRHMDRAW